MPSIFPFTDSCSRCGSQVERPGLHFCDFCRPEAPAAPAAPRPKQAPVLTPATFGREYKPAKRTPSAAFAAVASPTPVHPDQLREAFGAAFLSWNGFHTEAEIDGEWAAGTLAGEMFRAGALVSAAAPDPVVEANRSLLLQRSRVGVQKYGTTLASANLTQAELLQHALEEALDLANYLQSLLQNLRKPPSEAGAVSACICQLCRSPARPYPDWCPASTEDTRFSCAPINGPGAC